MSVEKWTRCPKCKGVPCPVCKGKGMILVAKDGKPITRKVPRKPKEK